MLTASVFRNFIAQAKNSDICALHDGAGSLSYRELVAQAQTLADWLSLNRVRVAALLADNSIAWIVTDLACQLSNIVLIPVPPFFSPRQMQHCLESSGADLLLTDSAWAPDDAETLTDAPVALQVLRLKSTSVEMPEGTQKITFTSGSTGEPKGVCLSVAHQWQVAQSIAAHVATEDVRHLCLLPLATLLENVAGVYATLLSHGTVIVADEQTRGLSGSSGLHLPSMLATISETHPTSLILLPQMLLALVHACHQGWSVPESLKFVAVGGARVSTTLLAVARGAGLPVYQGYGLSECGSVVALSDASTALESVGRVLPHLSVEIVDQEIIVRGAVFLGYLGQPDSWYPNAVHTGDLGALQQHELYIHGRKKNLLITSFGRNINPEWVEAELTSQPILSRCVVGGNDRPGLYALVSAPSGVSTSTIRHWINACNETLPDYARIHHWLRVDEPQWQSLFTPNGRPKRPDIEQHFAARIEAMYDSKKYGPTITASITDQTSSGAYV